MNVKIYMLSILFVLGSGHAYSEPLVIEIERLALFFLQNNIYYERFPSHNSEQDGDIHYMEYPDPADNETVGIFFEFHTGLTMQQNSGAHLGVLMRGTNEITGTDNEVEDALHRGRGIALGGLSRLGCENSTGLMIEDFSAPDGAELQHTVCLPTSMKDNTVYRIDIHASTSNVWAGIWEKKILPPIYADGDEYAILPDTGSMYEYVFFAEISCFNTPSVNVGPGTPPNLSAESPLPCYEMNGTVGQFTDGRDVVDDSPYGNATIVVAYANSDWRISNVFMATWSW